jgi:hypothetical protein
MSVRKWHSPVSPKVDTRRGDRQLLLSGIKVDLRPKNGVYPYIYSSSLTEISLAMPILFFHYRVKACTKNASMKRGRAEEILRQV